MAKTKLENKKDYYIEGIGRRKTSTARVRIYPNQKGDGFEVNGKKLEEYFPMKKQVKSAIAPFDVVDKRFKVTVQTKGGGLTGQSESIRLGLSRALVEYNEDWKKRLKMEEYLTRDSRMKERKKPGLRSARRPQQWRKR